MEKRNVEYEDIEKHDENKNAIEMNENKEAFITDIIFSYVLGLSTYFS